MNCPKCGKRLMKINDPRCDCSYMCLTPECRKGMYFPIYYGKTQKDIDGNTAPRYYDIDQMEKVENF